MPSSHSQDHHTQPRNGPAGSVAPGTELHYRPPQLSPIDPAATELVLHLREAGPRRSNLDVAVRRFVRIRRAAGRELESVVGELRSLMRDRVAPILAPEYREQTTTAVLWFAVSEFHRTD